MAISLLGCLSLRPTKTTLPFFAWLLTQREFLEGAFHTAYLDEVLAFRNGTPFVQAPPTVQDIAVIAAALHAVLSPAGDAALTAPAAARRWRSQARSENLRD